jgi:hypothetical protein
LALVAIAVGFLVSQVRAGIYPQLERPAAAPEPAAPAERLALEQGEAEPRVMLREEKAQTQAADLDRIDPKAHIQTGPGLPTWHWRDVSLAWNGPVERAQELRLFLIPPAAPRGGFELRKNKAARRGWRCAGCLF